MNKEQNQCYILTNKKSNKWEKVIKKNIKT